MNLARLFSFFTRPTNHDLERIIMAKGQEILDALATLKQHVADETAQVAAALADLTATVTALREQIDRGGAISAADADSILAQLGEVTKAVDAIDPDAPPANSGGGPGDGGNGP